MGISTQILFHPVYLVVGGLLFFCFKSRAISGAIVGIAGFMFASFSVTLPQLPEEGVQGKGTFLPESVAYAHSPFGTSWITKGKLSFTSCSTTYTQVPCQIYTPLHQPRPPAHQALLIEGTLLPKTFPHYVLKPTRFTPKPSSFSTAELRFQVKEKIRHKLAKLFTSQKTSAFLLSMITGEIDDRLMSLQFNRLGLLHLLGVSGFQFSLLALLMGALLRLFIPGHKSRVILILFLSAYAFMLGNSPPIQRAWIGTVLYAVAHIKGYQISPLNALGAALVWELLLDPCVYFQLGFQFSFLCTAAIFIAYPPIRQLLSKGLPGRPLIQIRSLAPLDRLGHILAFFCRETLALNLAIHLVSLPLLFFHFHKFALLSFAYNLFLPAAVSVAYIFLIPGLLIEPLVHFVAVPFLQVAEVLTEAILNVAMHPPALLDVQWRMPGFTLNWTLGALALVWLLFNQRSRLLDRLGRR